MGIVSAEAPEVFSGEGAAAPLALRASTVATIKSSIASENGLVVNTVIGTVHVLSVTDAAVEPSHSLTSARTPSDLLNLTLYAVTAAPRSLLVAGQVTTTSVPEFVVVAAASCYGTVEVVMEAMADQSPVPCRLVARY